MHFCAVIWWISDTIADVCMELKRGCIISICNPNYLLYWLLSLTTQAQSLLFFSDWPQLMMCSGTPPFRKRKVATRRKKTCQTRPVQKQSQPIIIGWETSVTFNNLLRILWCVRGLVWTKHWPQLHTRCRLDSRDDRSFTSTRLQPPNQEHRGLFSEEQTQQRNGSSTGRGECKSKISTPWSWLQANLMSLCRYRETTT